MSEKRRQASEAQAGRGPWQRLSADSTPGPRSRPEPTAAVCPPNHPASQHRKVMFWVNGGIKCIFHSSLWWKGTNPPPPLHSHPSEHVSLSQSLGQSLPTAPDTKIKSATSVCKHRLATLRRLGSHTENHKSRPVSRLSHARVPAPPGHWKCTCSQPADTTLGGGTICF